MLGEPPKEEKCEPCAFVCGALVSFILMSVGVGVLRLYFPMDGTAVKEAVKAGKAEYYLDAENQRQWRWKP